MDERELTLRAIRYLRELSGGVNPLDGRIVPEGELLTDPRIRRCLAYSADVMERGLDAPKRERKAKKSAFAISPEALAGFAFADEPISVSEFMRRLNDICPGVADGSVKRLSSRAVTGWLIASGLMEVVELPNGGTKRRPTPDAAALGIRAEWRQGMRGDYEVVLYDRAAQEFLLDNLDAILTYAVEERAQKEA